MATVELHDVRKRFGAAEVLRGITAGVADHEFLALVGPSGCGKSTLLRLIAGLEEVTSGEISIAGRVVNRLPPKARDIAMVFQNYALYPHMTVFDNMAFSLRLRGRPSVEVEQRVKKAADILGLGQFLGHYPRQLSGGQRQRVAMGRAIVRNPSVFLFDEPLSNLDAKLRVSMRTEIKSLHQRLGTTSIYVTHDQIEAMTMADRIALMRDGRIEQLGRPFDLYDRPVNTFVAGFIGSPAMNLIPGRIFRSAGSYGVRNEGGVEFPLDRPRGRDGQPVFYGVRPEHLALDPRGLSATVAVVEPTGAETLVFCDLAGIRVCASFSERHAVRPGETIRLRAKDGAVHLFDADNGNALPDA
jgi:multiple sugar transport system ATP-binding protein